MNPTAKKIQRIYLTLLLFNTLAISFIWGINTLFLLDAGLNNLEAFSANAFFAAGMVIFEVPTGIIADMRGRRFSYLLGTLTLMLSTGFYFLLWVVHATFWMWTIPSLLLGLGYTFFSGAVEAWLVDALIANEFKKENLEFVFAKGVIIEGIGMMVGTISGGVIAQFTNLGVPYIIRILILVITFVLAFIMMKDVGFIPSGTNQIMKGVKHIWDDSVKYGLGNPPVRWMMLTNPFTIGVLIYAFYAMQPYLLELYGNKHAYSITGLAAAIFAGSQIVGGLLVPYIRKTFHRRTSAVFAATFLAALMLAAIGFFQIFWAVIVFLVLFGLMFAGASPIRQTYINGLIPSEQRATVLSFDSLLGSAGGVGVQPLLGKVADVWSYPLSYASGAIIQACALPFILLARREKASADII